MNESYELWNRATANLIGTYDSVEQALEVVRRAVDHQPASAFADVALGAEDELGNTSVIAAGDKLVALALGSADVAKPLPSRQRIRRSG